MLELMIIKLFADFYPDIWSSDTHIKIDKYCVIIKIAVEAWGWGGEGQEGDKSGGWLSRHRG